jgi:hypothetical protein
MQLKKQGLWSPFVPDAPTIGTAIVTGSTTATVAFTAPASDGGLPITLYTATSSPGGVTGTLSQAGSGTITVSGLTASTAYTFTVKATNAVGQGAASAASNSITTLPVAPAIGSSLGGGYYSGRINQSGTIYNLITAPKASGQSSLAWKINTTGGDPTSLIDGPANSAFMNSATYPAAQFCEGLTIGGFSDWYMPARNELSVQYYFLKPTTASNNVNAGSNANAVSPQPVSTNYSSGSPAQTSASTFQSGNSEAFTDNIYWSSTQDGYAGAGRTVNFSDGAQYSSFKYAVTPVRAVRRVTA